MTRVLVHVQWRPELDPDVSGSERDQQWADLLTPLVDRAFALGGRIVGWAHWSLTVDFSTDGLYDAIDFLVDAPLAPELASGICYGEPLVLQESGRLALAVGEALTHCAELATLARPGEVLVSPEAVEESGGKLGTTGEVGSRPGRPQIAALVLDPSRPLLESLAPHPPSSRRSGLDLVPAEVRSHPPSSRAPESLRAIQVDRMLSATLALGDSAPTVFPEEMASAMRSRDTESLQRLAESIRETSGDEVAERMDAMAQLARGKSGEALRRLRRAKLAAPVDDPSARCRASLALAVALAAAGRPYEAALEGLDGLARARQANDTRGKIACARFLSQLSGQFRDRASSDAWARLG